MERLRVVVGGYLGLLPAGGVAWDYVQYPAGLAALGHDVWYVEDTRLWPVYQQADGAADCTPNVRHLAAVMEAFGLGDRWAYRDEASGRWFGRTEAEVDAFCRSADVLVNVSCATALDDRYAAIPARALVDSDPMFTQIQWAQAEGFTVGAGGMRGVVAAHTHHFTFGESVGRDDCRMPDCGVRWIPTRQPVCLDRWPVTPLPPATEAAYTTVMNWTAGRRLAFDGECWGQKDVEFLRLLALPDRVPDVPLAVAVGQTTGAPFPQREAQRHGWRVLDPTECAPDWRAYRDFLAASRGELSVAKETYVKARTGWFSCRSACYLASGRPVVTQDTGWSRHLPTGEGLIAFDDLEGAADALHRVEREPAAHARAARRVAEAHFDARDVLARLLIDVGA